MKISPFWLSAMLLLGCRGSAPLTSLPKKFDSLEVRKTPDATGEVSLSETESSCEGIYTNGNYAVGFRMFSVENKDEEIANTLFAFRKQVSGKWETLYSDSLHTTRPEVIFADFSGDRVPDILIQHSSDVRSNNTYHLYLVDTAQNKLQKVKGFGEIKNPTFIPEGNFIESNVVSGTNWTGFYDIVGDTVRDFDLVVYDNQQEDRSYERDYQKALKGMAAKRKQHK